MMNRKTFAQKMAVAGAFSILLGSSAFAQDRTYQRTSSVNTHSYTNKVVEGTVERVSRERGGERVRLTNGMDLVVPNSVVGMNKGRRYRAAMLRPGDVVRLGVYSKKGDGRDAVVQSIELVQNGSRRHNRNRSNDNGTYDNGTYNNGTYNNGTYNDTDRRMSATVVGYGRNNDLVVQTDDGQTMTLNVDSSSTFRRGDRVTIMGHLNRGTFVADDVRLDNGRY